MNPAKLEDRPGWTVETKSKESPASPWSDHRPLRRLVLEHEASGDTVEFSKKNFRGGRSVYKVKVNGETRHSVNGKIAALKLVENEMGTVEVKAR